MKQSFVIKQYELKQLLLRDTPVEERIRMLEIQMSKMQTKYTVWDGIENEIFQWLSPFCLL